MHRIIGYDDIIQKIASAETNACKEIGVNYNHLNNAIALLASDIAQTNDKVCSLQRNTSTLKTETKEEFNKILSKLQSLENSLKVTQNVVTNDPNDEQSNLEKTAKTYAQGKGNGGISIRYSGSIFLRHKVAGSILELGPAEGIMTDYLYPMCNGDYTIVDGSVHFTTQIRERYPHINAITSLFEDYEPQRKFSNILLGHVLEHVEDPVSILQKCKNWLEDKGIIYAAVPNANSYDRHMCVGLGMLKNLDDLGFWDIEAGHKRVFFLETFFETFRAAGLEIAHSGGYYLKQIREAQIRQQWTSHQIKIALKLGEKHPDKAGSIYVIAKHKKT